VPALAQFAGGIATTEVHLPCVAVAPDLDIELLRERIDATDADAVQAAGDFVVRRRIFAAGMELGEYHLHCNIILPLDRGIMSTECPPIVDNGDELSTWMTTSISYNSLQSFITELSTTS